MSSKSSLIYPFKSNFILPIFFVFIIIEWTFFLVPTTREQMVISIKVFAHVIRLNLIREGICIGKKQRRVWVIFLNVFVVEIIHQRF